MKQTTVGLQLNTPDGLKISIREFSPASQSERPCLLVVPGFAQHSSTTTFGSLCKGLAQSGRHVFCLDLRGTGFSQGRYSFGSDEYHDVLTALAYLHKSYGLVDILGFSLGAYSALRAASHRPQGLNTLYLGSCPTSVNEIVSSGAVFKHAAHVAKNPDQFGKERALAFRWGWPLRAKPSAVAFAAGVQAPVHFLVGEADRLTPAAMSLQVYNAVTAEKSWTTLAHGRHAEQLYFQLPEQFLAWLNN